ncbi:MAG: hypothetical protein ACXWDO_11340, partial [Bacteroidia bacterium]
MNRKVFFFVKLFALFLVIAFTCYLLWQYRAVFNSQRILNNKEYAPLLDSINTVKKKLLSDKANKEILGEKFVELISNRVFPY